MLSITLTSSSPNKNLPLTTLSIGHFSVLTYHLDDGRLLSGTFCGYYMV